MANRRMINKDDFELIEFQSLTLRQRYLFWATNLFADDDGIIPTMIAKSKIYPIEGSSLDEMLEDYKRLEELNFVIMYGDNQYVQICDWWTRQFIDGKIYKPTKVRLLPPSYMIRPPDLKKYHSHSRTLLEQNSAEENSTAQTILDETRIRGEDVSLPFDRMLT